MIDIQKNVSLENIQVSATDHDLWALQTDGSWVILACLLLPSASQSLRRFMMCMVAWYPRERSKADVCLSFPPIEVPSCQECSWETCLKSRGSLDRLCSL